MYLVLKIIITKNKNTNMKPVQCKNCKYFVRDIFYKSEGICNNDGRYTREHHVCNLLDTTDHDQLVCPNCKLPFTKEELQIKEHCFNCGWEFANF